MGRGDVVYVDLPPASQHEQAGTRPAVAVQATSDPRNPMLIIVPFTSKLSALQFPHTIRIEPSKTNGLSVPSVLLVFQLRAISKGRIVSTIGRLEDDYMGKLERQMRLMLGL
jgi:mRNA interferase MazF